MGNGAIATRWAQDEVRALAKRFFEQAHNPPCEHQCTDHKDVARALGYILTGLDEMLARKSPALVTVVKCCIPIVAICAGIAYGVGKLLGI